MNSNDSFNIGFTIILCVTIISLFGVFFHHNYRTNAAYYEVVERCESRGHMWIPLGSNAWSGICLTRGQLVEQ